MGDTSCPALCDAHMHIESGMLTPAEFARAVIPHGTTSMFTDPHEIANVLGLDGVRMMHDEAHDAAGQYLHPDAVLRTICTGVGNDGL